MPTTNFGFPRAEAQKLLHEIGVQVFQVNRSQLRVIYYLFQKCYVYLQGKLDLNSPLQILQSNDKVSKISERHISKILLINEYDTIYGLDINDISLILAHKKYRLHSNIQAMLHLMRSALLAKQLKFDEAIADINSVDLNDFEMSAEKEPIANIYMQALNTLLEYLPWKFFTYFLNPECSDFFFKKANALLLTMEIPDATSLFNHCAELCKFVRLLSETDEIKRLKETPILLQILECYELDEADPNCDEAFMLLRKKIQDSIDKLTLEKAKECLTRELYVELVRMKSRSDSSTCSYQTILTLLHDLSQSALAGALPADRVEKPVDLNVISQSQVIQVENFIPPTLTPMRFRA